jgi:uncharacterized membrane protein YraQ (UPF0718 family)
MLGIFTKLADWSIAQMGLTTDTHFGASVHFFIEDLTKIFVLIYVMIFVVSLFRSQLSPEKVRDYLSGKSRWYGYILAVILGVITPFCSCSSIPLFIGFIAAGVPFGITMAFLIASPLVSEIAAILLLGMEGAGPTIAGIYVLSGSIIAIIGGYLCDLFHLEKYANYTPSKVQKPCCSANSTGTQKLKALLVYAHNFAWDTLKSIGIYIVIGLIIGAGMHGYIPAELFAKYLGANNVWAVPFAAVVGAPMYASHAGVVPIIQVLLMKGVPVGTALVALMSITAISIPEMIMLKKVLKWQMLAIFVGFLIVAFIITGYLLNWIM